MFLFTGPRGNFIFLYIFDWSLVTGTAFFQNGKSIDSEPNCAFCQMGVQDERMERIRGRKEIEQSWV